MHNTRLKPGPFLNVVLYFFPVSPPHWLRDHPAKKGSSSQSRISSADLLSCSRLADGIVAGRPVGQPPPSVAPPPPPPKTDGRRETSIKCHSEEEEDYSVKSLLFFLGEIALLFYSLISGTDDHELFLIILVCLLVAKWSIGPQIGGESNRERRIGF